MNPQINKIIIGTANFAQVYNGVRVKDVDAIFNYCREVGINMADTAVAYGSEDLIPEDFQVVSKLPIIQKHTIFRVQGVFFASLRRLRRAKVYGYLLHRPSDYGTLAWKILKDLKRRGLIEKIGISIYEPTEIQNVDLLQVPYKKFKPYLPTLKAMGIEVHARKVFADACYLEAMADENVDRVVIGVDNVEQLKENVKRIL